MADHHDRLISYCQWRAHVMKYQYSGKATWGHIQAGTPIRGAVYQTQNGELVDTQFPHLLYHFLDQERAK